MSYNATVSRLQIPPSSTDLSGEWRFGLDAGDIGVSERWCDSPLADRIHLPGTLWDLGVGETDPAPGFGGPQLRYSYEGRAWYQREVEVDRLLASRRLTLFLERCSQGTALWANGRLIGTHETLVAPHVYDLTGRLNPGRNTLTVMVDNRHRVGSPLDADWETRAMCSGPGYNGIVGRIELHVSDLVSIDHLDVYPGKRGSIARVRCRIGNVTGLAGNVSLLASVTDPATGSEVASCACDVALSGSRTKSVDLLVDLANARHWTEFDPALYELTATLEGDVGGVRRDRRSLLFGRRCIDKRGKALLLNGRRVFLRGRVEHGAFPKDGRASMDVESWVSVLSTAKAHGLNHVRFHSWCPPEAAFVAADRMGFFFHVEPGWIPRREGEDEPEGGSDFMLRECWRIIEAYGNHPSFCFLSVGGNEQLCWGPPYEEATARHQAKLMDRLDRVRRRDRRHLYTCTTGPWTAGRRDDYYASAWGADHDWRTKVYAPIYGCRWGGPDMLEGSRYITDPPTTDVDYRAEIEGIDAPVVSHEIGQWAVFPDIREIEKHTGVYRPVNLEAISDLLRRNGLIEYASDFASASGQLSLRLYKDEIEFALRTPGFGGFQLLDLIDYPWQNTATVGILDAYWQSKGLISEEGFRRFCGPTVPLARMPKLTWTVGETLTADIEIAHYGERDIPNETIRWVVRAEDGEFEASGAWSRRGLRTGQLSRVGRIAVPLEQTPAPAKLCLSVLLENTGARNDWELWVYPEAPAGAVPAGVEVHTEWNQARAALARGGVAVFVPGEGELRESLPGVFPPVYWSWLYFRNRQVGTMGLLIGEAHPALRGFPTEYHSNWQWWEPVSNSRAMVLDGLPSDIKPIVRVIDKFDTCRRLAAVFEAGVGSGRLLVSSIDLINDLDARPVSRQLRRSILDYVSGPEFAPGSVDVGDLDAVFGV